MKKLSVFLSEERKQRFTSYAENGYFDPKRTMEVQECLTVKEFDHEKMQPGSTPVLQMWVDRCVELKWIEEVTEAD